MDPNDPNAPIWARTAGQEQTPAKPVLMPERLVWSNGDVWVRADNRKDYELGGYSYGFTLDNCKQQLNQFFQRKKLQTVMQTAPLGVVGGFRSWLEFEASGNLHVRLGITSASKKASQVELALYVCKVLCKNRLLPPVNTEGNPGSKDQIVPEEVGLAMSLRNEIRRFTQVTCNLNPVERGQDSSVTDVGLKIDAAPWSISANYESEGAIAWSPPSQCPNPWGGQGNHPNNPVGMPDAMQQNNVGFLREMQAKMHSPSYAMMQKDRMGLPIWNLQHAIVNEIESHQVVICQGSTGCGKTTQIPQFLLDYYIGRSKGSDCNVAVTQPRRVAAMSVAQRVSAERCEPVGQSCGYMVRFDTAPPRNAASIMYMTVGVLLKRLASGLHGISHMIIDEVHERDVNTDFLLVVVRRLVQAHPGLRLMLMSATMDIQKLVNYFARAVGDNQVKMIDIPGRTFPVQTYFLEDTIELLNYRTTESMKAKARKRDGKTNPYMACPSGFGHDTRATLSQLNENEIQVHIMEKILEWVLRQHLGGAVLIFLPGWESISQCTRHFKKNHVLAERCYFLPMHSQVPKSEQAAIFDSRDDGRRKVVLSTNIAETSITIPDVSYVIDSCRCKFKHYKPIAEANSSLSSGSRSQPLMSRMDVDWAAKHNLVQRTGRAGRTHSGVCFRLCTRLRFESIPENMPPEMVSGTPLHQIALMIKWLRLGEIGTFLKECLDPPENRAIQRAIQVLQELYCVDQYQRLTPLGVQISKLPIEPKFAYAVILSNLLGVSQPMCILASAACYQDPINITSPLKTEENKDCYSDHIQSLRILYQLLDTGKYHDYHYCKQMGVNGNVVKQIFESSRQLEQILVNMGFTQPYRVAFNKQRWDIMNLLIAMSLDHFAQHQTNRRVWIGPQETGQINQQSTCADESSQPPYQFYVIQEQASNAVDPRLFADRDPNVLTHTNVQCRSCTNVPGIPIILGSSNALIYTDGLLYLDGWLPVRMSYETASLLGCVKACLESLMLRLAHTPQLLMKQDQPLFELQRILFALSDPDVVIPVDQEEVPF